MLTATACDAGAVADLLGARVAPPARLAPGLWRARVLGPGGLAGFGTAQEPSRAQLLAVMELAERTAQFTAAPSTACVRDTARGLGPAALGAEELGLHSDAQYDTPGFDLQRLAPDAPLEWVVMRSLLTGAERFAPLEAVHPHAVRGRARVVAETSSGTAAHVRARAARLAALCEIVERDAALLLWHRRPPTRVLSLTRVEPGPERDATVALRSAGAVVVLLDATYDIAVPVVVACCLEDGGRFAHGLGCDPDPAVAAARALREVLHARADRPAAAARDITAARCRTPADHAALYDGGPLAALVPAMLDMATRGCAPPPPDVDDGDPLDAVVGALAAAGFDALSCDITPPALAAHGVCVTRALVPGLVPLSFGADRVRLGCARLVSRAAPGRLATLLPHFLC